MNELILESEIVNDGLTSHAKENLKFISNQIRRLEVSIPQNFYYDQDEDLDERVNRFTYFHRLPESYFLEDATKTRFMQTFDIENPRYEVVRNMQTFIEEMRQNK